ncbi:MAG: EAL domain-containing protein, partial [Gammaproteobacteria bacterium]|nr:EAL domain-containing protein [Gammaproteobacteria bacterium]
LRDSGMSCRTQECSDPNEGCKLASMGNYDCILMDFRFPTGVAFDFFDDLLAQPCSRRPPVILLTGQGDEKVAAQSIQRGAQEYLSKNELAPATIRRAIESACEKAVLQREIEQRDEDLRQMSFHDTLTSLPNRRLFFDRLEQAVRDASRADRKFAALIMDLNLFKIVNDSYGHAAGDELLIQTADRLKHAMRDSDTIARLGGDEFAAILSSTDNVEGARIVAEKICTVLSEPFIIEGQIVHIGTSIGISMYPEHGTSSELLIRRADMAMYEGKRNSRAVTVYGSSCSEPEQDTLIIARGIPTAVRNREMFPMYQPQVNLEDGTVTGVEALVRWEHPQLGLLPPSKFLPALERSEHMEALTLHMLESALAEIRAWRSRDWPLTISVNLSARLLDRDDLILNIEQVLNDSSVPPECLCLEVTETGIMHSPKLAEKTLCALSELGIQVSIDDFGTGYSSLKYLRNFPIDEIKIDRLFVAGLINDTRDALIVESVLALGNAFNVRVLAEGIEDNTIWDRLQDLGCKHGQGFHIGHPMTPDDFEGWYKHWESNRKFNPAATGTG